MNLQPRFRLLFLAASLILLTTAVQSKPKHKMSGSRRYRTSRALGVSNSTKGSLRQQQLFNSHQYMKLRRTVISYSLEEARKNAARKVVRKTNERYVPDYYVDWVARDYFANYEEYEDFYVIANNMDYRGILESPFTTNVERDGYTAASNYEIITRMLQAISRRDPTQKQNFVYKYPTRCPSPTRPPPRLVITALIEVSAAADFKGKEYLVRCSRNVADRIYVRLPNTVPSGVSRLQIRIVSSTKNPFVFDPSAIFLSGPIIQVDVKDPDTDLPLPSSYSIQIGIPWELKGFTDPRDPTKIEAVVKPISELQEQDIRVLRAALLPGASVLISITSDIPNMELYFIKNDDARPRVLDLCTSDTLVLQSTTSNGKEYVYPPYVFQTEPGNRRDEPFRDYFIGIFPKTGPTSSVIDGQRVSFSVTVYRRSCIVRDEGKLAWSEQGCKVINLMSDHIICTCQHMSVFAATQFVTPIFIEDVVPHTLTLIVRTNLILPLAIGIAFLAFGILLLFCNCKDEIDEKNPGFQIMVDEGNTVLYYYLITIYTGGFFTPFWKQPTSNVAIQIYGCRGSSIPYVIKEATHVKSVLENNSMDSFLVSSFKDLGTLEKVRLWRDNHGRYPDWVCRKIIVRSINSERVDYFIVNKTLTRMKRGTSTTYEIPKGPDKNEKAIWKRRYLDILFNDFHERPTWFSSWKRSPGSRIFTRCQRICCAFVSLFVNLLLIYAWNAGFLQNGCPSPLTYILPSLVCNKFFSNYSFIPIEKSLFRVEQLLMGLIIFFGTLPVELFIRFLFKETKLRYLPTIIIYPSNDKDEFDNYQIFGKQDEEKGPVLELASVYFSRQSGKREDTQPFSIPSTNAPNIEDWLTKGSTRPNFPHYASASDYFVRSLQDTNENDKLAASNKRSAANYRRLKKHIQTIRKEIPSSFLFPADKNKPIEVLIEDEIRRNRNSSTKRSRSNSNATGRGKQLNPSRKSMKRKQSKESKQITTSRIGKERDASRDSKKIKSQSTHTHRGKPRNSSKKSKQTSLSRNRKSRNPSRQGKTASIPRKGKQIIKSRSKQHSHKKTNLSSTGKKWRSKSGKNSSAKGAQKRFFFIKHRTRKKDTLKVLKMPAVKVVQAHSTVKDEFLKVIVCTYPSESSTCSLPRGFIVVWWILAASIMLGCSAVVIFYGINLGWFPSWRIITDVIIIAVANCFITQPLYICLVAGVKSCCNNQNKADPVFDDERFQVLLLKRKPNLCKPPPCRYKIFRPQRFHPPLNDRESMSLKIENVKNNHVEWGLINIFSHLILMVLLVIITYTNFSEHEYLAVRNIRGMLHDDDELRQEVRSEAEFFNYVRSILYTVIYPEKYYNGEYVQYFDNGPVILVDQVSYLVGVPRLHQFRIHPDSICTFPVLQSASCLSETLIQYETRNFSPGWKTLPAKRKFFSDNNVWDYQENTNTYTQSGMIRTYPVGGYLAYFGRDLQKSLSVLNYLQGHSWIDGKTRGIFLEFTSYNPNVNLFFYTKLMFEISGAGSWITSIATYPLTLLSPDSNSKEDTDISLLNALFVLTTLAVVGKIFIEISIWKSSGRVYLTNISMILLTIISLGVAIKRLVVIMILKKSVDEMKVNIHVAMDEASYWDQWQQDMFALTFSFGVLIFWEFIFSAKRQFFMLHICLKLSSSYLLGQGLILVMLMLTFSIVSYILFHSVSHEFHSLLESCLSMLQEVTETNYAFQTTREERKHVGQFCMIVVSLVTVMVGFNLFISIIEMGFIDAKRIAREKKSWVKYHSYILNGFKTEPLVITSASNQNRCIHPSRILAMNRQTQSFLRFVLQTPFFQAIPRMRLVCQEILDGTGCTLVSKTTKRLRGEEFRALRMTLMESLSLKLHHEKVSKRITTQEVKTHAAFHREILVLKVNKLEAKMNKLQGLVEKSNKFL